MPSMKLSATFRTPILSVLELEMAAMHCCLQTRAAPIYMNSSQPQGRQGSKVRSSKGPTSTSYTLNPDVSFSGAGLATTRYNVVPLVLTKFCQNSRSCHYLSDGSDGKCHY